MDIDKYFKQLDEIEEQKKLEKIYGRANFLRFKKHSVIKRLPNGKTIIASYPDFFNIYHGK